MDKWWNSISCALKGVLRCCTPELGGCEWMFKKIIRCIKSSTVGKHYQATGQTWVTSPLTVNVFFSKKFRFQKTKGCFFKELKTCLVATENIGLLARCSDLLEICVRENNILLCVSLPVCACVCSDEICRQRHGAYVTCIDCFRCKYDLSGTVLMFWLGIGSHIL